MVEIKNINSKISDENISEERTVKSEKNMPLKNKTAETMILDDETKAQIIKDLTEKAAAKSKKVLTYTEVSDRLGDMDIDKDQMDDIYETLMSKGIEVNLESEPDDIDLLEIDEDEIEDPEVEAVIAENPGAKEIDLEATISKNIAVDDPVRMYLKEIGKVPLLYSSRRK